MKLFKKTFIIKFTHFLSTLAIITITSLFNLSHQVYAQEGASWIVSDSSWKYSDALIPNWETKDFDDSAWGTVAAPSGGLCGANNSLDTPHEITDNGGSDIWSKYPSNLQTVYFRKTFTLDTFQNVKVIKGGFDDDGDLYVNGTKVYADSDGIATAFGPFDITQYIVKGKNIISARVTDTGGGCQRFAIGINTSSPISCGTSIVQDFDGNIYNTTNVNGQCWMTENLRVGTMIPGATNQSNNATIEKYCYDDNPANCSTDGGLYQWNEAMQYSTTDGVQGICPSGWHIPTDADWHALENYLKDTGVACDANRGYDNGGGVDGCEGAGTKMRSGTPPGLNIPTAGARYQDSSFEARGGYAFIWSSSQSGDAAWIRYFYQSGPESVFRSGYSKEYGLSIRCLQNSDASAPTPTPTPTPIQGNSNVAFFPGIKGSRLYNSQEKLWEPNNNGDTRTLGLDSNGVSIDKTVYTKGIIDKVTLEGLQIKTDDIYKSFISMMDQMVADKIINTWQPMAYDWRFDVRDTATADIRRPNDTYKIISELEQIASQSKTKKVTIVAHSMGGLVAKAVLLELQKQNKLNLVDRLILIASPQLGTPQAILSMLHGEEPSWIQTFFINQPTSRVLAENMPSAYGLLPSEAYFSKVPDPVAEFDANDALLSPFRTMYGNTINSKDELNNFLLAKESGRSKPVESDVYTPNILNNTLLSKADETHSFLDNWTPPVGIDVFQIVGWGLDTVKSVKYNEKSCSRVHGSCKAGLRYEPVFTIEGDSTVVYPSASALNTQTFYLNLKDNNWNWFVNQDHGSILESNSLKQLVNKIIANNIDTNNLPNYISLSKPNPSDKNKALRVSIHSPVALHLYDNSGNHTGPITNPIPNSDLQFFEKEIPNSYYLTAGESKYLGIGTEEPHRLELDGQGFGTFTLIIDEVENDTIVKSIAYKDIPVNDKTKGEIILQTVSDTTPLKIDVEGNGSIDYSFTPSDKPIDPKTSLDILVKNIETLNIKKPVKKALIALIQKTKTFLQKGKPQIAKMTLSIIEKEITAFRRGKLLSDETADSLLETIDKIKESL